MGGCSGKDNDDSQYDYLFKVVLTGELGVGKSSIALQYLEKTFTGDDVATIGAEFRTKTIDAAKKRVKLQLWDTAGQEKFRAITVSYFRGASAVIVVFDVTNKASIENLKRFIEDALQVTGKSFKFLILGNKIDLTNQRQVTQKEVEDILHEFQDIDYSYKEASAKTGYGVNEAFKELAESLVNDMDGKDNRLG
eukprot:TRINITY_DN1692_c1_g2_i5.p1 TRINITY_DN1692_c1_g2~~TRINITY_DN1692_c1_g2_i5.p1  ORF type:complete len:194 (+),score=42.36 TRINITY_DN1692_c1_g2_i5:43-624(+)